MDQPVGIVNIPTFIVVDLEGEAQGNKISDWQKKRTNQREIREAGENIGLEGIPVGADKAPPTRQASRALATASDGDLFQYRQQQRIEKFFRASVEISRA